MKAVEEQLAQYKCVHLNKKNIQTHFVGIPLIVWAITLLLSLNSFQLNMFGESFTYTPAMIFLGFSLIYYFKLHFKLALGMLFYIAINLYLANLVVQLDYALWLAISTFVIGWIIQFIGHIYEKAKPAFFDDIMGLIIGPLFLMAEVYFSLGLERKLHKRITPMAIEKRRLIERAK